MLAYAASRPPVLDRRPHPNTMLFIIGAHVALVAAVMSAKMELPPPAHFTRTIVDFVPLPAEVPAPKPVTAKVPQPPLPTPVHVDHPLPLVPVPDVKPPVDTSGPAIDSRVIGAGSAAVTPVLPPRPTEPVKSGPRLITPPSELKPPYPASKLLNEEEAVLTLRLTISEAGRVLAVDPVGRADPVFLEAARRHLIAHWRFKPATEDGHAVNATTVITLRFELNG